MQNDTEQLNTDQKTASLFCNACSNLLTVITSVDDFYYKCIKCQKTYKPNIYDTLRFEEIRGAQFMAHKTLLHRASRDPVNPKIKKECSCGNDVIKQIRIGDDMKLVNICPTCNKQWIEGTE